MANNPLGLFSQVPKNEVNYSKFDKSFTHTLSMPSGVGVPVVVMETTPGEKFRINPSFFMRANPLLHPTMSNCDLNVYWFSVPKRIIDDQFEQYYTRGPKGRIVIQKVMSTLLYLSGREKLSDVTGSPAVADTYTVNGSQLSGHTSVPQVYIPNAWDSSHSRGYIPDGVLYPGSLFQYLGYPVVTGFIGDQGPDGADTNVPHYQDFLIYTDTQGDTQGRRSLSDMTKIDSGAIKVDMMRWFAYWLIYDEYFRNQQLTDPIFRDSTTGVRKHIRDYFRKRTSNFGGKNNYCWYFTEAGLMDFMTNSRNSLNPFGFFPAYYDNDYFTSALPSPVLGDEVHIPVSGTFTVDDTPLTPGTFFDVSQAGAIQAPQGTTGSWELGVLVDGGTIQQLKQAFALDKWKNISNRFNNRFDDVLYGHFGVRTSDQSLQRPQYLGGGSVPIRISEVDNTAASEFSPLGEQAGRAISSGSMPSIEVYTEEPSIIMAIATVRPEQVYYQGVDKLLTIEDSLDEYTPEFQHIGMEPIKCQEVNVYGLWTSQKNPSSTFGYQSRFSRYKFEPNRVSGLMVSDYKDWMMTRDLSKLQTVPTLSPAFQFVNPQDVNRVFALTESSYQDGPIWHNFILNSYFSIDDLQKMDFHSRTY